MSETTDPVNIYTFFAPEIGDFLLNNNVDLAGLLRDSGYRLETKHGADPTQPGSKDVVPILLASAALGATLLPILTRLLEELLHRAVKVTELVPVALTDDQGKAVLDSAGREKLVWVERTRLIERKSEQAATKIHTSFMGLKFEYASTPVK